MGKPEGKKKRRKPYVPVAERMAGKGAGVTAGAASAAHASGRGVASATVHLQPGPQQSQHADARDSSNPVSSTGGHVVGAGTQQHPHTQEKKSQGARGKKADGRGPGGEKRSTPHGGGKKKAAAPEAPREKPLPPVVEAVIQPNRKAYGGMGFARPSVLLVLGTDDFADQFLELYSEHIDGFTGKAFVKARRREMSQGMLWRVKLREKHGGVAAAPAGKAKAKGRSPSSPKTATATARGGMDSTGDSTSGVHRKSKPKSKQRLNEAVAQQRSQNPKIKVDDTQRLRAIELYRQQKKKIRLNAQKKR